MTPELDTRIIAAINQQIAEEGEYKDPMAVVDMVMDGIDPSDYAATLRLIVSQRISIVTPGRSTK